jgi:hypothetical protein
MSEPAAVPAAPPHQFATLIPDRRPKFKTHKGVGQAKNAIIMKLYGGSARHDMVIYQLEDGEYRPWIHIARGQVREDVPELAPPAKPKSHVEMEIRQLVEQERRLLAQAASVAEQRRELEAAL